MRIEDWMKFPVQTIKPLDSLARARAVLEQYQINQLPVVLNRRLVGIITDRDLRSACPSVAEIAAVDTGKIASAMVNPDETAVERVMTEEVITLGPKDSVEQAARLMLTKRIGAIPIVEKERLVGIISRSDILGAFLGVLAGIGGPAETVKPARGVPPKSTRSKPPRSKPARSKVTRSKSR
ncbi:MAG: CBS domain-containing protein [Candidatus Binataceae bacterium]